MRDKDRDREMDYNSGCCELCTIAILIDRQIQDKAKCLYGQSSLSLHATLRDNCLLCKAMIKLLLLAQEFKNGLDARHQISKH